MTFEYIHAAAHLVKQSQFVAAFTGAGISTPSGIPDFRSPHSGLWHNVDPMTVASMSGFRQNPQAFYNWIYPLLHLTVTAQPNAAHLALARLETLGKLKAVITQNIDLLHSRAGSHIVHELHGHIREATCIHCFTIYPAESLIVQFLKDRRIPHCPKCHDVLKPNVILFGEQLPIQPLLAAKAIARQCDLMFIIGSSLEVAPAADIPLLAQQSGAKLVIINLEPTLLDSVAQVIIRADAAEALPQIVTDLEAVR